MQHNNLQVLADDDVKVQLKQEVDDLKTAAEVSKSLDEKLAWLDEFNTNIIDYNKICTELEGIVAKDRTDLDALIKPAAAMKSTDRLVSAMDLADDIRAQVEIASAKQQLWDQGLAPEGKENTPEVTDLRSINSQMTACYVFEKKKFVLRTQWLIK